MQLAGFRLHPGPLPEHYRYLNTTPAKKHKNKHKKHKHKDGALPQETSPMGEFFFLTFFLESNFYFKLFLNLQTLLDKILMRRNIKNRNDTKTIKNVKNEKKRKKGKNSDIVLNMLEVEHNKQFFNKRKYFKTFIVSFFC